jgi:pimeloyl-ACP methyl ester carboxylesterase
VETPEPHRYRSPLLGDPIRPEVSRGPLQQAELVEVDDCFSFTPEDQPGAVAEAIARFAA